MESASIHHVSHVLLVVISLVFLVVHLFHLEKDIEIIGTSISHLFKIEASMMTVNNRKESHQIMMFLGDLLDATKHIATYLSQ